jgi:hypothetical protein
LLFISSSLFFSPEQTDRTQREVRDEIEREIGRVEGDGNREREIERTKRDVVRAGARAGEPGRSDRPEAPMSDGFCGSSLVNPRDPRDFRGDPKPIEPETNRETDPILGFYLIVLN